MVTGPICVKCWSPRVSAAEVRQRCRVARETLVCNAMWYVPWLHWTVARWVVGEAATHGACNQLLARFPGLRDLHPGNVVAGGARGAVVVGFSLGLFPPHAAEMPPHATVHRQQFEQAGIRP